jgi:uncharacterized protein (DUF302 family)
MSIRQVEVQRFSLVSSKSMEAVMIRLEAAVGHPDMSVFRHDVAAATASAELEIVIGAAVGTSGLMEFTRFDIGAILRMYQGERAQRSLRLVVGNPVIMKQMVEHVPDAASYAPVTVLIDERSDGVHVSYDRMASFLAPYGNPAALKVAQDLDAKIESLLAEACT